MATSLLCETVTGRSMTELVAARDAVSGADLVELRLDGVNSVDVDAALRARRLPAVVTCRPAWEGGRFEGDEDARRTVLLRALDLGAEFVDVEWRALANDPRFGEIVRRAPERSVVSMHDFEGVPADLADRARAMRATGAGVIKIAVACARLTDTLALLPIARGGSAVVVGMGDAGVPSRLLAARYGSRWTYAGHGVAPGQMPAPRMVSEYGYRRVGSATRLFGVVGSTAIHSLSPAMHNAAFEAGELDAVYVPLAAADFDDFLVFADALGIAGASVTIPFKVAALGASAAADDRTRAVGATNTLRRLGPGQWEATNTDLDGFLAPLDAAFPRSLDGVHASVLGAGGSARAVIVALLSRGARVTVHARRSEQTNEVARLTGASAGAWPPPPGSWDLLVNCTPLGGAPARDRSPLPGGPFTGPVVYDLTYGPGQSRLIREAAEAGCVTLDGLPMLIAQAERQFEWWTGQRPRPGVMAGAARARLSEQAAAAAPGTHAHGVH